MLQSESLKTYKRKQKIKTLGLQNNKLCFFREYLIQFQKREWSFD